MDCWRCFLHLAAPTNPPKPVQMSTPKVGGPIHWKQRLERATYEAQRAARQYHAVEPENRLVARELEGRWERSLAEQRSLQEEYERFRQRQPSTLTQQERETLLRLATDIPALWRAPETTPADRKVIVRHLIESVEVTVQGQSERVEVAIQSAGGFVSRHEMLRPVRRFEQMANYEQFMSRISDLYGAGRTAEEIARELGAEGWLSPRKQQPPTAAMIRHLLSVKIPDRRKWYAPRSTDELLPNEWWLSRFGSFARHAISDPICMGPAPLGPGAPAARRRPAVGSMGRPRRNRAASPSPQIRIRARRPFATAEPDDAQRCLLVA